MVKEILGIALTVGLVGIGVALLLKWGKLGSPVNRVPEECPDIPERERLILELHL